MSTKSGKSGKSGKNQGIRKNWKKSGKNQGIRPKFGKIREKSGKLHAYSIFQILFLLTYYYTLSFSSPFLPNTLQSCYVFRGVTHFLPLPYQTYIPWYRATIWLVFMFFIDLVCFHVFGMFSSKNVFQKSDVFFFPLTIFLFSISVRPHQQVCMCPSIH